jgi:hypothetical protein
MYSEKRLCKELLKQLRCSTKSIIRAEKMMLDKRPAQDVYYQFKATLGGLKKIEEQLFPEIMRADLNKRTNRLLSDGRLCHEHTEALTHIQKQISRCPATELFALLRSICHIEQEFLNSLFR